MVSACEDEDAAAAELRRGTPVQWSRMFSDVKTSVPVNQVALMTSLRTHFECVLAGRTDRGNGIADLLEDTIGFMDPLQYAVLWSETLLCYLPAELAIHARALELIDTCCLCPEFQPRTSDSASSNTSLQTAESTPRASEELREELGASRKGGLLFP